MTQNKYPASWINELNDVYAGEKMPGNKIYSEPYASEGAEFACDDYTTSFDNVKFMFEHPKMVISNVKSLGTDDPGFIATKMFKHAKQSGWEFPHTIDYVEHCPEWHENYKRRQSRISKMRRNAGRKPKFFSKKQ